ncbi:hypothetical protein Tco_0155392 [Tanacetum coccineum]
MEGYGCKIEEVGDRILQMKGLGAENVDVPQRRMASRVFENASLGSDSNTNWKRSSSTMNPFTVNIYHDGVFVEKPFEYTHGDFKVIDDVDFEGMLYVQMYDIIRRVVLVLPTCLFFKLVDRPLVYLKPLKTDEDVGLFVKALYDNDSIIDLYCEHNGYDIMEMIQDQIAPKDQSVKPPFKCNAADYAHSTHENLEDLKDILVGKGTFIGQTDSPIANLCGRFIHEENHHEDDIVDPKFKAKKTICYHLFDPSTPWDQCKPVIGMKFENPLQVKNMLANYGVANGYQLWFMQNDYSKLLMYCGRDVGDSSSKPDHVECSKPVTRNNDRTSQAMKKVGVTKKNMKTRDYKKVFTVHLGCGHPG